MGHDVIVMEINYFLPVTYFAVLAVLAFILEIPQKRRISKSCLVEIMIDNFYSK